ncbi:3,4-dihydroxy-2-butanone-4-phosphate synthase [Neolewinella lacunae]|uniref:3,4-dihydroxy-2-butanone 4-phosphate synthase n=1 Tax=Neolewinella lacunae TaxID=1517758 RepID=A0A923PL25_9BACT|nr:3,4-dihydroxy-2-butanone-4-phosphate synthase [Neolewinella lacunae]MBC6994671.1 3,4-dihydroxy-2-butanone-4-phosphate synthase [Neolewinella lacunae]MDN3634543.1 3,4-dihydroxy-2-butanone-4-phosphate synthase [Neolewinella lacunae]
MSGNHPNATDTPEKAESRYQLNTIEEAVADIRAGKIVIVVDDEDRENEGDFVAAAERVTPEMINFMATHGRGLICTPIEEGIADRLELRKMVETNTDLHETAFSVSIDLIGHGCTTGISAYDRATCIRRMTEHSAKPTDFTRPGHVFPLRAVKGGVLRRTGHTEAAVDLARMANLFPAGVIVEILKPDGEMARLPYLLELAKEHNLKVISIEDLVAYRLQTERLVECELSMSLETRYGPFKLYAYRQTTNNDVHLALTHGQWMPDEPVLTRVHSSTSSRDLLHSLLSGYSTGLHGPLEKIAEAGKGVLLFMRPHQDGSEVIAGLRLLKSRLEDGQSAKLNQPASMDQRDFGIGAQILRDLKISKLRILSNHPKNRVGLEGYGLEVVEFVGM